MLGRIGAGSGAADARIKESGSNSVILRVLKRHARFLQGVPSISFRCLFRQSVGLSPSCYDSKVLYERCTAMANTLCPAQSSCVQRPIPAKSSTNCVAPWTRSTVGSKESASRPKASTRIQRHKVWRMATRVAVLQYQTSATSRTRHASQLKQNSWVDQYLIKNTALTFVPI